VPLWAAKPGYNLSHLPKKGLRGEKTTMKKFVAITVLTLGLTVSAMAAQFKGFVEDANCATKPAMKGNAE
jgi:hypothetical protein